jgi:hypothetical protein
LIVILEAERPLILNRHARGLVPGIHVFGSTNKAWMAGTSQDKPGHDEWVI